VADRFERLTNLVAVLLATPRPLTLEELVSRVPGYPPDAQSARRQFERDKDALRELTIPIELVDDPQGDLPGYRIDPQEYELPDLDLTPDERAALHTAVAAMRLEGGEGREALWKVGGDAASEAPTLGALPSVPALPALMEATRRRVAVRFTYRGDRRVVEPYAVVFRNGNWYLMGHDLDRNEQRSFRADRIDGEPALAKEPTVERPADFDPDALLHDEPWRYGDEPAIEARVRIDPVMAAWVTQRLAEDAVVEHLGDGSVIVQLTVTNRDAFRSFVLDLLDHAVVISPDELRDEIVDWLRKIVAAAP